MAAVLALNVPPDRSSLFGDHGQEHSRRQSLIMQHTRAQSRKGTGLTAILCQTPGILQRMGRQPKAVAQLYVCGIEAKPDAQTKREMGSCKTRDNQPPTSLRPPAGAMLSAQPPE
jgi:hypothetical protein